MSVFFLALFGMFLLSIGDARTSSDLINLESPWGASSFLEDEEDDSYEDFERKSLASRGLYAIIAVSNLLSFVIFNFLSS